MPDYIQIKASEPLIELCTRMSKRLPGNPRPNEGSFAHFAKYGIEHLLKHMVKNHVYINQLFKK